MTSYRRRLTADYYIPNIGSKSVLRYAVYLREQHLYNHSMDADIARDVKRSVLRYVCFSTSRFTYDARSLDHHSHIGTDDLKNKRPI